MLAIITATPDISGFHTLLRESRAEGHKMLARLRANWLNGTNRFNRRGEILVGAIQDGALAGLCGRNVDPYASDIRTGRIRHLYVGMKYRRSGVGRCLIDALSADAGEFFDRLNVRAPKESFGFYERLGFLPVEQSEFVTHRLKLMAP